MKYVQEFWIELAVAIVIGALIYFKQKIPKLWRKAAARRFRKVIAYESAKHSIIQAMQLASGSKRVALCKAHNGGGVPKQGHDIKVTIDWEEVDLPLKAIKSEWQDRVPDSYHMKILLDLTRNQEQLIYLGDTETEVHDTHKADEVACSFMKEIAPTSLAYWYTVFFYTDDKPLSAEAKRKLSSLSANLKKLLSNKATLSELETWAKGM